jgi:carbon storage regulator
MLVLSRKVGEEILIGDNVRLTVLSTKGERVRIGIAAPPDVRVDRYELHIRRTGQEPESAADRPVEVSRER